MSQVSHNKLLSLSRDELIKRAEGLIDDCDECHWNYEIHLGLDSFYSVHSVGMYYSLFHFLIHELEEVLEAISMVDGKGKEWSDYVLTSTPSSLITINRWGKNQAIVKSKLEELKHLPTP